MSKGYFTTKTFFFKFGGVPRMMSQNKNKINQNHLIFLKKSNK